MAGGLDDPASGLPGRSSLTAWKFTPRIADSGVDQEGASAQQRVSAASFKHERCDPPSHKP